MTITHMPPRSPQFETPASRLAELVHLLADVPLARALDEIPHDAEQSNEAPDPLWVVASALVRLRRAAPSTALTSPAVFV